MNPSSASLTPAPTNTENATPNRSLTISQIINGTDIRRVSVIMFGMLRPSRVMAGSSRLVGSGAREPPDRVAALKIEFRRGQARLQLVHAADVLDVERRLLARQRFQVDLPHRRHRGEAVAQLDPIVEPGDRRDDLETALLVAKSRLRVLPAIADVGGDRVGRAPKQVGIGLARA